MYIYIYIYKFVYIYIYIYGHPWTFTLGLDCNFINYTFIHKHIVLLDDILPEGELQRLFLKFEFYYYVYY